MVCCCLCRKYTQVALELWELFSRNMDNGLFKPGVEVQDLIIPSASSIARRRSTYFRGPLAPMACAAH
jgi:hypothetical protein